MGFSGSLNKLAQLSHEEQKKRAQCLVLEAVVGSGNSVIMHTASNTRMFYPLFPLLTYTPFSRLWIPAAAKLTIYPAYNPFGQQVYKSAKKLSPEIPVVILHDRNDPQCPLNDARDLYCTLRECGNNKAYLIETAGPVAAHVNVLDNDILRVTHISAIHQIFKENGLPYNPDELILLRDLMAFKADFQPDPKDIRRQIARETWTKRYLRNTVDVLSASALVYGAYRYVKSKMS